MGAERTFSLFEEYVENCPALRTILSRLNPNTEVGFLLGDILHCTVFWDKNKPQVEARTAKNPPVTFHIRPETVESLSQQPKTNLTKLSIEIFKEIMVSNISIETPKQLPGLLSLRNCVNRVRHRTNHFLGLINRQKLLPAGYTTKLRQQKNI